MGQKRPVEDLVIKREQKKDRYVSWAAAPVSLTASENSTVKGVSPGTEENSKVFDYE